MIYRFLEMCKDSSTIEVVLFGKVIYTAVVHKDWFWERWDLHTSLKMCLEWVLKAVQVSVFSEISGKRWSLKLYCKPECPSPCHSYHLAHPVAVDVDPRCTSFSIMLENYYQL